MKIEWDVLLVKFSYYFVKYGLCLGLPTVISGYLLHDSLIHVLISNLSCLLGGIYFHALNVDESSKDKK